MCVKVNKMQHRYWHFVSIIFFFLQMVWIFAAPTPTERIENYENFNNEIDIEDENAELATRNALKSQLQRWPSRTLYYKISNDYSSEEVANVHKALEVFNERTCLKFVPYDAAKHRNKRYLLYKKSENMCGTRVGYNPLNVAPHDIHMNEKCLSKTGVIQHETLHVLGLYHEQSRPDRDQYVQVDFDNIEQKYWSQFASYPEAYATTYDVPYDFQSIMHYSQFAFAKDPQKPSMRAYDGENVVEREMGQVNGPSEGDLTKIRIMYKCN